jgi:hypothetical protein
MGVGDFEISRAVEMEHARSGNELDQPS